MCGYGLIQSVECGNSDTDVGVGDFWVCGSAVFQSTVRGEGSGIGGFPVGRGNGEPVFNERVEQSRSPLIVDSTINSRFHNHPSPEGRRSRTRVTPYPMSPLRVQGTRWFGNSDPVPRRHFCPDLEYRLDVSTGVPGKNGARSLCDEEGERGR